MPINPSPGALTHPDLEELAAFLDGTLPEKDRARVVEHLADCEECYEIFAGAARFQEDSQAEDEPEEPWEDSVLPFPPQQKLEVRRWLPLAAAALLAVAVGAFVYRMPPNMAVGKLTAAYQEDAQTAAANLRFGPSYRGGESAEAIANDRDTFQLGAQVTNLQVGLQADSKHLSESIFPKLYDLLSRQTFMDDFVERSQQIRNEIEGGQPPREFLDEVAKLDADLEERLEGDETYFNFGKWTAAAWVAAATPNADFFDRRDNRRFPSWLLRTGRESLEPDIATALDRIQQILAEDPIDYATLRQQLETILNTYDA